MKMKAKKRDEKEEAKESESNVSSANLSFLKKGFFFFKQRF